MPRRPSPSGRAGQRRLPATKWKTAKGQRAARLIELHAEQRDALRRCLDRQIDNSQRAKGITNKQTTTKRKANYETHKQPPDRGAGGIALSLFAGSAQAQYKPTGDDGITASPKQRQFLDEVSRNHSPAPAVAEIPAMPCAKCKDKVTERVDYSARGKQTDHPRLDAPLRRLRNGLENRGPRKGQTIRRHSHFRHAARKVPRAATPARAAALPPKAWRRRTWKLRR